MINVYVMPEKTLYGRLMCSSTIVRGILEADVSLDGYVYFEGENNMVNSSEVTLEFEFQFEHQNGKNRQFVSRVTA